MPLPFVLCCLGIAATQFCMTLAAPHPLLGPVFEPPTKPSSSSHISLALSHLRKQLGNNLQSGVSSFGNFTPNATSVSITIISTSERVPLIDFHFSSPLLENGTEGTSKIDSSSVYRIGSIYKLLTVYGLLLNGAEDLWNHPVTDFIPELKDIAERDISDGPDRISNVIWDEIAIGALASQLSGIGRECKLL
jgi:hypothetical protein